MATLCKTDQHIMDAILDSQAYLDDNMWKLNYCQLFLQVMTLSDIRMHCSTLFMNNALTSKTNDNGNPALWHTVKSTLEWPTQPQQKKTNYFNNLY